MYNYNICELLSEAKKVRRFTLVDYWVSEETGEWKHRDILTVSLYEKNVFATRNGGKGNLILLSTSDMLMDDLYHLCHLVNYDVNYDEFGDFRALELIGANGGSQIINADKRSLFVQVDYKNPDHYFDK